ncbi:MAG TPA: serine hydrolase domain-containing protein [Thermoanaerobaculia bacterium]
MHSTKTHSERATLPVLLMAALAAACASQPGRSPGGAPARHEQIDAIFRPWDDRTTPGCAVAVSRDGVLDYARGYGMASLEHGIPITPQTVFPGASLAKQFVAFSVALLAQDGKLSLDDDIRKHLPEIPDYGRTITIAHLIHHTNGLREQHQLLNLAGWRGGDSYTEEDVLRILSRQRRLNFEPGSEIVYGNAAYTLLGVIVRRVSGQPLRAFAKERIFEPLGMADTRFGEDHTEIVPRRAPAYSSRAGGGWSVNVPFGASTGLFTTVGDLLKWEQNLIDARVGGPAVVAWMQTSGRLNDGTETGYGGGLILDDYRGLRTVRHDGLDGGYRAEAVVFPDQRLAIVALCNAATVEPTDRSRRMADVYLSDQVKTPALAPAVAASDTEQAAWAGVYWSSSTDEVVQLEWRDGALRQAGSLTPFVPIGDGIFRPSDQPHEWRFVTPAAGAPADVQPELRIRDAWRTSRVFRRVSLPLPEAEAQNAFAGQYHSDETEMTYTVRVAEGRLRLTWPRGYDIALEAVGGDRFVGSRGTVTFTRTASGNVNGLTVSNRRLRRLFAARVPIDAPVKR